MESPYSPYVDESHSLFNAESAKEEEEEEEKKDHHDHYHHHQNTQQRHSEEQQEDVQMESIPPPQVEVVLSRQSYRLGETIVGTVRLLSPSPIIVANDDNKNRSSSGTNCNDDDKEENDSKVNHTKNYHYNNTNISNNITTTTTNHSPSSKEKPPSRHHLPRTIFKKASLYIAGRCKVDSRWHNISNVSSMYGGGEHPFLCDMRNVEDLAMDAYFHRDVTTTTAATRDGNISGGENNIVVFWSTNVLNLLELKERDSMLEHSSAVASATVEKGENRKEEEQGIMKKSSWQDLRCDHPLILKGSDWSAIEMPPSSSISNGVHKKDNINDLVMTIQEENEDVEEEKMEEDLKINGHSCLIDENIVHDNDDNDQQQMIASLLANGEKYDDEIKVSAVKVSEKNKDESTSSLKQMDGKIEKKTESSKWEEYQISFSFRTNLPEDIPHSANVSCVAKYFYSAVVSATTVDGEVSQVFYLPFVKKTHKD
uniref:Uncharacterized protein n=1 Tax=Ditylum brightwellii TaxID=49249 RepID=A0A7S1YV74_9STRA|mmetsp:Transcript_18150/g.27125  ORF Transcript_18150/g.27125 Transcript_18150/m.27125 type:complete len:483 (+) Transcript_18150:82-1530(+)